MIQPSLLMRSGVQVLQSEGMVLFKFTPQLHEQLETLLDKQRSDALTELERAELTGLQELDRILTLFNSQLAVQHQWSPSKLAALSAAEPETDANIATPLSL
ncbi:MAG: hypothetical protein ACPGVO_07720 [Spirulinaceae cyanobacterium]